MSRKSPPKCKIPLDNGNICYPFRKNKFAKVGGQGRGLSIEDHRIRGEFAQFFYPSDMFGRPTFVGDILLAPLRRNKQLFLLNVLNVTESAVFCVSPNSQDTVTKVNAKEFINITDQLKANAERKSINVHRKEVIEHIIANVIGGKSKRG